MDNDWSKHFKDLLDSEFGAEIKRALMEDLHNNLIKEAQLAKTQEEAYGLLKEASGVIKALDHLQFRTVAPK